MWGKEDKNGKPRNQSLKLWTTNRHILNIKIRNRQFQKIIWFPQKLAQLTTVKISATWRSINDQVQETWVWNEPIENQEWSYEKKCEVTVGKREGK